MDTLFGVRPRRRQRRFTEVVLEELSLLKAATRGQTIEQPKRARGLSVASAVTWKRPCLNRA